mmetsp:Transcript_25472/g.40886  ORF Transcript_25472/g.40886 Transcript_25472/m.40886 type:complete len:335 (+) Transcript_25472:137-1141(+)
MASASQKSETKTSTVLSVDPSDTFRTLHSLEGHKKSICSLKFSGDGKLLASASADSTVKIWNFKEGTLVKTLSGIHEAGINDISWGKKTSKFLCSASDDNTIVVWNVEEGKVLRRLKGHTKPVFSACFNKSETLIVSGGCDFIIRVWSVRPGKIFKQIPGHTKQITAVDFNNDGKLIVSGSFDGLCRIWETETGNLLRTIGQDNNFPVYNVKFVPNEKYVLCGTLDGKVCLWDFRKLKLEAYFKGHKSSKYCASISIWPIREKQRVVSGSEDGCAYMWNASRNATLVSKLQHSENPDETVLAVACHPDGYVATGSLMQPVIRIWLPKLMKEQGK